MVIAVDKKESVKKPPAPFTTSTMLSTASKALKLSSKTISTLAQSLFEKGLVTYIRTDSTSLSDEAVVDIRNVLQARYPKATVRTELLDEAEVIRLVAEATKRTEPGHCSSHDVGIASQEG